MNQLTKTQITVGCLAFFATVWSLVGQFDINSDMLVLFGRIFILLVVLLIISMVILGILEWIKIFDLKTNSIITLVVLITIGITSSLL